MSNNHISLRSVPSDILDSIHGPLPIPMTNDYLFRALMQQNNRVLRALICSLLHLDDAEVNSVIISNPIELGKNIDDKTYILDIKVNLNGHAVINLEMQVVNEGNWPERSLCYLCRAFDNLNRGQSYEDIRPAIQIGLLNFTLFPDSPEFFANYYMANTKNHKIYSDKLRLSVLDLTQADLATAEDHIYRLDRWAAFFKARTWEELKMLAKNDSTLQEAAVAVWHLTLDEKIRQICEAREDYYRRTAGREELLQKTTLERDQAIAERDLTAAERDQAIAELDQAIAERDLTAAERDQAIAELNRLRRFLEKHEINVNEEDT